MAGLRQLSHGRGHGLGLLLGSHAERKSSNRSRRCPRGQGRLQGLDCSFLLWNFICMIDVRILGNQRKKKKDLGFNW